MKKLTNLTLGELRLNFKMMRKSKWDRRLDEMKRLVWESELSFSGIYDKE